MLENLITSNYYLRAQDLPASSEAVSVQVHNGIVTSTGRNVDPLFAFIARTTVQNTAGVKDVIDDVQERKYSDIQKGFQRTRHGMSYER